MEVWQIPEKFRPKSKVTYPLHQTGPGLETEIENRLVPIKDQIQTDLIYLPIKWTEYYLCNRWNNTLLIAKRMLQEYVDGLPKTKKFFTVVQYDDGIMVDFPNCLVFSAGGKPDDAIPIPLLCDPHKIEGTVEKDIPISLIANLDTHPIRKQIAEAMYGKEYCYIAKHYGDKYVETIRRSYFTICPRGYGKTSFRMYEAMQLGTVPAYISDEFWLPFYNEHVDWYKFLPMCNKGGIEGFINCLYEITQDKKRYNTMYKDMDHYRKYFTYDSVAMYIRRKVEHN